MRPHPFSPYASDTHVLQRGRKLGAEDLQLLLLDMLAQGDGHGYELGKGLEARSGGAYQPSAGVIYPALNGLEQTGLVQAEREGNRKRYRITPAGRERLGTQHERVVLLWTGMRHAARKMEWIRRALAGEPPPDPDGAQGGWLPEFVAARMAMKRALLLRTDADAAEQRRIAAILTRAVAEIDTVPPPAGSQPPSPPMKGSRKHR